MSKCDNCFGEYQITEDHDCVQYLLRKVISLENQVQTLKDKNKYSKQQDKFDSEEEESLISNPRAKRNFGAKRGKGRER